MNPHKSKLITNEVKIPLNAGGRVVEWVQEADYIGQIISFKNQTTKETNRRMSLAWKKY